MLRWHGAARNLSAPYIPIVTTQHALSRHLEAVAEADVPPRSWAVLTAAADRIAETLFPTRLVGLRIVGAGAIRELNRSYRCVDEPTDVLSFPADDATASHAGDVALCWDAAVAQARANGNAAEAEALALIAHGMLHLAGFDHPDAAGQEEMDRRTRELCCQAGYEVSIFGH